MSAVHGGVSADEKTDGVTRVKPHCKKQWPSELDFLKRKKQFWYSLMYLSVGILKETDYY